MGLGQGLAEMIRQQRGHLLGWVPVCMALGVGLYFALRVEPPMAWLIAAGTAATILLGLAWRISDAVSPLVIGMALVLIGFDLAAWRAHAMAAPILGWRYYGTIEGRIIAIDRSQSDALRLTLDQLTLGPISPARTPDRVRISLVGDQTQTVQPAPGLRVVTTGHLAPPSGPVEPQGFDFKRYAWFKKLGAVGYTRKPVRAVGDPQPHGLALSVLSLRMAASAHIQQVLPGDVGGFASAITTGDRSAISRDALLDLRASNLAHLLAILGLHMGLLCAVVFAALRGALALIPWVALRWPTRSIAACGALVAATGYLALSGGNVATERSYIMAAVALGALMMGRRMLTLRAVAIAAVLVLGLRPEALTGPGFQMSFAATTALVAVFGWLRDAKITLGSKMVAPVVATVLSSAVASAFTAPVGAAHFNTVAHYGLLANLLSVPLMGLLVMPSAVAALVLAPLGLDGPALWVMGCGLRWILGVAFVADIDGNLGQVITPGPWVLPLVAFGFLWLVLWQGWLRFLGAGLALVGLGLWPLANRPAVLIADTGTLVGMMTSQGRALSKEKSAGFIARNWLENDGDGADQPTAHARWTKVMRLGPAEIVHLSGKRALAAYQRCARGQIVIVSVKLESPLVGGCDVYDPIRLRDTGSVTLGLKDGDVITHTARQMAGTRLWTNWPERYYQ